MDYPEVYAVKHKDLDIRMASRSGGIFTAVSDYILDNNGVVYGCMLTEDLKIIHQRSETYDGRNKMRGSKYVQSDMCNVFREVKKDLDNNRYVLFSGTSCQSAGLQAFLGKKYEKLICVDIVCHGVPSPLIFEKYIQWQESQHGKCTDINFRNKKDFGWAAHIETLTFKKSDCSELKVNSSVFKTIFYSHAALRPCCYKCPYKDVIHPADITIADYWGIEKAAPGFSDNKGVSLVLINNKRGAEIFSAVKENTLCQECRIENSMQPPLKAPFPAPKNRAKFWEDFSSQPFSVIAEKYGKLSFITRVKKFLKKKFKK